MNELQNCTLWIDEKTDVFFCQIAGSLHRWIPKMRIKNCKPTKTIWSELIGYAEFAKLKLDKFWASKILNWNRNFSLGSWPCLGKFVQILNKQERNPFVPWLRVNK